jgi:thiol-disulfide isomerase/thioredoxin
MKKIFLILQIIISLDAASQTKGQFQLNGQAKDMEGQWIYLSYGNQEGKTISDSTRVQQGKFSFTGRISQPTISSFYGKMNSRGMDDANFSQIFLEPTAMTIEVKPGQFKKARVTGSKTQVEFSSLQDRKQKVQDRWKIVMDTLSAVNKRSNFAYQEMKNWVLVLYFAEMMEIDLDFFSRHPSSYVTAYMMRFRSRDFTMDSLQMYYNRLSAQVKQSSYGKYMLEEIARKKIGIPGTMAAAFTSRDLDGKELSLSDYRGKYVLLDFWASWCLPCRKGNPHLRQLYAKYKTRGFEVIGVASDDGHEDKWRKAVEQDSIGIWKHVLTGYDPVARDRSKAIGTHYSIESLPTQILIDPKGMIIGRYGEGEGETRALDQKLESIFKN